MYLLPSPLSLRDLDPASDSDQSFVRALYRASRSDLLQMQAEPAFVDQLIAMQQRMQEHGYRHGYPQARHLAIDKTGLAIGRLIVHCAAHSLHVVDIALLPQEQGQGAGAAVLAGLQRHAAAQGRSVSLAVNKSNAAALKLYARLGFVADGEDELQQKMRWSAA